MFNQTLVEPLVSSTILHFTHHIDWPVMKPYSICKSYGYVFSSVQFKKDYLINLFNLSPKQQSRLHSLIAKFSKKPTRCSNNLKRTTRDEDSDEDDREKSPPLKNLLEWSCYVDELPKKKHIFIPFPDLDQVYGEILKIYVKCCLPRCDRSTLEKAISQPHLDLEKLQKCIILQKANNKIQQKFKLFHSKGSECVWKIDMDRIYSCDLSKLWNGSKGCFLIDFETQLDSLEYTQSTEFVIFTSCGFPIVFKNEYYFKPEVNQCFNIVKDWMFFGSVCNKYGKKWIDKNGRRNYHSRWEELYAHTLQVSEKDPSKFCSRYSNTLFRNIVDAFFTEDEFFNALEKNLSQSQPNFDDEFSPEELDNMFGSMFHILFPIAFVGDYENEYSNYVTVSQEKLVGGLPHLYLDDWPSCSMNTDDTGSGDDEEETKS